MDLHTASRYFQQEWSSAQAVTPSTFRLNVCKSSLPPKRRVKHSRGRDNSQTIDIPSVEIRATKNGKPPVSDAIYGSGS